MTFPKIYQRLMCKDIIGRDKLIRENIPVNPYFKESVNFKLLVVLQRILKFNFE